MPKSKKESEKPKNGESPALEAKLALYRRAVVLGSDQCVTDEPQSECHSRTAQPSPSSARVF